MFVQILAIVLSVSNVSQRPERPTLKQTWNANNGNGPFSNPLYYDEFSDLDLIPVCE
jgi:xylan 1,4-beta-xylosidase